MSRRAPLPPSVQGSSFALISTPGLARSRTRSSDLETPSRGIRRPRDSVESYADQCRPYQLVTGDSWLSHVSAAKLHGIPLPYLVEQDLRVHLGRPLSAAAPRRRGVVGRRADLQENEVVDVDRLRVTSPARTWLDLASMLRPTDLIIAGDHLVSRHRRSFGEWTTPIVSLDELSSYVLAHERVRGLALARRSLPRLRIGVDSPPETMLRLMLEDAGLPAFEVDVPIIGSDGVARLWPDLSNRRFEVAVEYDGAHHLTPEQQFRDMNRDALTSELGWLQVKVNALDLRQGGWWVASKVGRALERRGWRPS